MVVVVRLFWRAVIKDVYLQDLAKKFSLCITRPALERILKSSAKFKQDL